MNNRRSIQSTPEFGLMAWLETTRIALPLKGVECHFDVTGTVASVELDQIYHQGSATPLDCTYVFPLPSGAAVYRCEVQINGRVIRARVEERGKARRIAIQQKAAGHRTALVESERENLFTLSLGNLQPDDLIIVRFAWFQTLDTATDGLRLLVPTCPGVRYIPGNSLLRRPSGTGTADDTDQVPDASRISPPRIDQLHPDAAYFCIDGRLAGADVEPGSVSSPSHPIEWRERDTALTVTLASRADVPDRDFVLTWREPKTTSLQPRGWQWTDAGDGYSYALALLRGPENVPLAEGYYQDIYFLVDRSGSMQGTKWQCTCEALRAFVQQLGPQDRVWITLFESRFRDFAEKPIPAAEVLKDPGFQNMVRMGTAGGTELLPAAQHVLRKVSEYSADRFHSVVIITDGQVGNEAEIEKAFRRSPETTVHTFGIDTAVNDAFLRALARRQRGCCWLQTPNDDITGTISGLGARLRRPVLNQMQVRPPWEVADPNLPSLRGGEVALIPLRMKAAPVPIGIVAQLPDSSTHDISLECTSLGGEALKLLWAKERIAALLGENKDDEAIAVARKFNVLCKGAAFIAWDEAEQVQIAERTLVQPAMDRMDCCLASAPPSAAHYSMLDDDSAGSMLYESASVSRRVLRKLGSEGAGPGLTQRILSLRQHLTQWIGNQDWIKHLLSSARGTDPANLKQTECLIASAEFVADLDDGRYDEFVHFHRSLRDCFRQLVQGPADDFLAWRNAADDLFPYLDGLIREMRLMRQPVELMDCLLLWVCPRGLPERVRGDQLRAFLESLNDGLFSVEATIRRCEAFVASADGLTAEGVELFTGWVKNLPVYSNA